MAVAMPLPNAALYKLTYTPTMVGTRVNAATWHDIQHASTVTQITMLAAWGGTATIFAMLPWHDKPWAMTVVKVAGGVAIAGIIGGMMLGGE